MVSRVYLGRIPHTKIFYTVGWLEDETHLPEGAAWESLMKAEERAKERASSIWRLCQGEDPQGGVEVSQIWVSALFQILPCPLFSPYTVTQRCPEPKSCHIAWHILSALL